MSVLRAISTPLGNEFSTPADIQDLKDQPALQAELDSLWNTNVEAFTQQAICGDPWNTVGASNQVYYYDPTVTDIPPGSGAAPVTWFAFPNRLNQYVGTPSSPPPNPNNLPQASVWQLADTGYYTDGSGKQQTFPQVPSTLCPQANWQGPLRPYGPYGPRGWQDEYCEWSVTRNVKGQITRVDFVCENPEYWYSLWRISPDRVAQLYQDTLNAGLPAGSPDAVKVNVKDLQLLDPQTGKPIIDPSTGAPAYNPLNKWNSGPVSIRGGNPSGGAMHLTSTPNTLQTEMGLAGAATVLRSSGNSDAQQLICCSQYGQEYRHSDPHIGQSVNQVISGPPASIVSLANPVGLYIQMPDFSGYTLPKDPKLPPSAKPQDCWQIVRGSETLIDPITGEPFPGNFILHAAFQLPQSWIKAGVSFSIDDISIKYNGKPYKIQYAAQITETFQIGLFARPLPAPSPEPAQACVVNLDPPQALAQPIQMMYEELWRAYYGTSIPNPVAFPMSLASNTVIVPAAVRQGASGLSLVLTCSTAFAGPKGQLPSVSVPGSDIQVQVASMSNVTYAAPGNSYPSEFQLLTLKVDVSKNAQLGLRSIVVTNFGQAPSTPGPAYLNVVSGTA